MIYGFLFYVLAALIVTTTAYAVTRRNIAHAVVCLMFSFFGTAMLFYLLGAPFLAALEVIIYAGAIMVVFLFVVMMIKVESSEEATLPSSQWLPVLTFGLLYGVVGILMIMTTPGMDVPLRLLTASPKEFALYVFQKHWFSIEIISLLLLVALVGVMQLGKRRAGNRAEDEL